MSRNKLISYILGPSLIGLGVAAVLLIIFPQFRYGHDHSSGEVAEMDLRHSDTNWNRPVSYAEAVQRAAPSVVNIYTLKLRSTSSNPLLNDPFFRRYFNYQQQRIQNSLGSGVIMSKDGYVLTNLHVVNGADEIIVLLHDGREGPARVIGVDAGTDLAVLKINTDNLRPISIGNPSQARIGDVVLAIGNPFGVGQSVTQGIISATGRNGLGLNTFENFIQTDADINPGNSGGALVDAYGNLLGINAATLNQSGSTGISFAIPADTAVKVLQDIIENGRVVRGWLGLDAIPLTAQIAARLNINLRHGLLVRAIYNGSPAHMAGLMPADVLIEIDGQAVTDRQSSISQIADIKPGAPIRLTVWRNGEVFTVTAVAGTRPAIDN